jgi:hypothetical protein
MAILAEHIQRINAAVRQSRLRPGVGYLLKESSGGTSLVIDRGTVAGGGGGTVCQYFEVTDASVGTALKVQVAQNLIAGRWPDGMGLDFPPFILEISGNSYIYAKVIYNTTTLQILPDSDAITILQSGTLQENTADSVYILLATVVTDGDPLAITEISNVCSQPVPNPCNLAWSA